MERGLAVGAAARLAATALRPAMAGFARTRSACGPQQPVRHLPEADLRPWQAVRRHGQGRAVPTVQGLGGRASPCSGPATAALRTDRETRRQGPEVTTHLRPLL